jgi:hypothetical protein
VTTIEDVYQQLTAQAKRIAIMQQEIDELNAARHSPR